MHILNIKDENTSSKHLFLTEFVTNSTARKKQVTRIFIIFRVQTEEGDFSLNKPFEFSEAYSKIRLRYVKTVHWSESAYLTQGASQTPSKKHDKIIYVSHSI